MSFTEEQKAALAAKLDAGHVKQRDQSGRKVSYIEGWHAIAEANRIFGFDGWSRETVETVCVWSGNRETRNGPKPAASYICRVRVRVGEIVREGTGSGSGFGSDVGEAHESAVKEAETDAMKRALITFGNPFGLALYDKTQESVERSGNASPERAAPKSVAPQPTQQPAKISTDARREAAEVFTSQSIVKMGKMKYQEELSAWWRDSGRHIDKLKAGYPDLYERLAVAADKQRMDLPHVTQAA